MTITFVDANGTSITANAVKLFMPTEFKQLFAEYKSGQSAAILTYQDIAFIAPDRLVEPIGYPHWITEILVPSPAAFDAASDIIGSFSDPGRWTPELRARLDRRLEETFGSLNSAQAAATGFGKFLCKDYNSREKDCIGDDQRRYGEIPLNSHVDINGRKAPWIWCTGRDATGINPIQHGDSGGPIFIRALDGRWLFAGFTSNGSPVESCASSILSHLRLFAEAANWFQSYTNNRGGFSHSAAWREAQIERFMHELFESWSSPNDEALLRLQNFYLSEIQFYGKRRSFADILEEKRKFAQRWPQRNYRIRTGSIQVNCNEFVPDKFCSVSVIIDWTVSSSPDFRRQGASQYKFNLNVWNMHHGYGGDKRDFDPGIGFPPLIMEEGGRTLSQRYD